MGCAVVILQIEQYECSACPSLLSLYCLHHSMMIATPTDPCFSYGLMLHDLHYIIGVPGRHANACELIPSEQFSADL
jgi:hypothetical protein